MPEITVNNISSNMSGENPNAATSTTTSNTITQNEAIPNNNNILQQSISPQASSQTHVSSHLKTRLPWGAVKEKPNLHHLNFNNTSIEIDNKKPGEYLMHIVVFNFIQLCSKKFEHIVNGDKREKRLKECFHKNEDIHFDKLVQTMGQVAEHSLPSLTRTLLIWHESQMNNLIYLKQQATTGEQLAASTQTLSNHAKLVQKNSKQLSGSQANASNTQKLENEFLDERKELTIHSMLCIPLNDILKQLSLHPGNDELLNYIIDLAFQRFLVSNSSTSSTSSKETPSVASYVQHNQLYLDNQYVTDLYAEIIGTIAQARFILIKRRFLIEFNRLKLNISPLSNQNSGNNLIAMTSGNSLPNSVNITTQASGTALTDQLNSNLANNVPGGNIATGGSIIQGSNISSATGQQLLAANTNITLPSQFISPTSSNIIRLLMGMKHFRIKMVPIEDFEASFHFLNDCAQYFVDVKDKDIKHTLAGLFSEILVPITGTVKNEVNIPCLKQFVDILYPHAMELSAKTKHRLATFPLLTCLLCVSQRQFFLNYWFQFAQLCLQQLKTKEQALARISLESILRLVWVYMIRIKGEKSSETNQRLQTIIQMLFPKGTKLVQPKEIAQANIFVKIINYIAYERLDFAMKEIIYELLSIDVNSNSSTGFLSNINLNSSNGLLSLQSLQQQSNLNSDQNNYNESNGSMQNNGNSSSIGQSTNSLLSMNSAGANSTNVNKSLISLTSGKENLILMPLRMEIGLRAFVLIADTLQQQKESSSGGSGSNSQQQSSIAQQPPAMPLTFNIPNNDSLSIYLNNIYSSSNNASLFSNMSGNDLSNLNKQRTSSFFQTQDILAAQNLSLRGGSGVTLTTALAREIGLGGYFEQVRRAFQDILKTLDATIGRTYLMTRVENIQSTSSGDNLVENAQNNTTSNVLLTSDYQNQAQQQSNLTLNDSSNVSDNNNLLQDNSSDQLLKNQQQDEITTETTAPPTAINNNLSQMSKELMLNAENKSRLCLMRTCIGLIPRLMPMFKENELVEILTRLTIHIDDELKIISFQALKCLVSDYPNWRKYIFYGFTNFILKEISDMYPKLIDTSLKMLIQLLNCWKQSLTNMKVLNVLNQQSLDDYCQIIYHLEGYSLFTLCHSNIQRRRLGLEILKECKQIGELLRCFKHYPYHNYVLDVLDLASIHAIKHLHLQCFNFGLILSNTKPDLKYLIDQSSNWETNTAVYSINNDFTQSSASTSSFYNNIMNKNKTPVINVIPTPLIGQQPLQSQTEQVNANDPGQEINNDQSNINENQQIGSTVQSNNLSNLLNSSNQSIVHGQAASSNHVFTFDPWTECLAIFFSYDFIYTKCPQARSDAWPFIYTRLQQLLSFVDPNEQPHLEVSRSSILFGVGANSLEKIRKAATERDANLNLWKNYLIGACCLTSGSDRYLFYGDYEKALIKTDESNNSATNATLNAICSPNNTGSNSTNVITNNPNTAMNVDFTIVESTSKFYTTFGTATSLLKMIVPFLKCECQYFREIVIRGLGRINVEAVRELVDELVPYIKECLDKRQEKQRRMKKRDVIRLAIVRIFELLSEQQILSRRLLDRTKKTGTSSNTFASSQQQQFAKQNQYQQQQHLANEQQLRKTFIDYVEGMLVYLEADKSLQDSDKSADINSQIRLHFSLFIHKLIESMNSNNGNLVPINLHKQRSGFINLFSIQTRQNLFNLNDKWSGRFSLNNNVINSTAILQQAGILSSKPSSQSVSATLNSSNKVAPVAVGSNQNLLFMHQNHYHHHNCYHFYDELELAATKACASLLCCAGFDVTNESIVSANQNNSQLFTWLSQLLENANIEMKMYDLCKCILPNEIYTISLNVCIQLLEANLYSNSASFQIFDWIINKCYSSISQEIADLCFIALSRVTIEYISQCLNKKKQTSSLTNLSPSVSTTNPNINVNYNKQFDSTYSSALLSLSLLNIGSTRLNIHETSICLLRAINKFYLQEPFNSAIFSINNKESSTEKDKKTEDSSKSSTLSSTETTKSDLTKNEQTINNNISISSASKIKMAPKQPLTKTSTLDRNIGNNGACVNSASVNNVSLDIDYDIINSMVIYSKSQLYISEYLARKNPEQTLFVFCEITSRLEQCASHQVRRTMLNVLVPWFYNLELSDPNVISDKNINLMMSGNASRRKGGNGSLEATQIILNNLFYLTCKFGDEYTNEFELIWAVLASTWRSNLKIIIRFIFIMISLASYEMIKHGKHVICYLSRACPDRVVDELITEIEFVDSLSSILDKCENTLPFYRYNKPAPVPSSPSPPVQTNDKPTSNNVSSKKSTSKKKRSNVYYVNQDEEIDKIEAEDKFNVLINQSDISSTDDDDDDSENEDLIENDDEGDDESNENSFESLEDSDEDDEDDLNSDEVNDEDNEQKDSVDKKRFKSRRKSNTSSIHSDDDNKLAKLIENDIRKNNSTSFIIPDDQENNDDSIGLPLPPNYQLYCCPLNILIYHLGYQHHHNHHHHNQSPIHSYHNNYLHHIHYPHLTNLSRSSISLMLLCELIGTDGADYDWTPNLPILLHYCLINFDSTKHFIGEHAKKLFLNILYILTVQNELYSLTDHLIDSIGSVIDNQSIIWDRKYTNNSAYHSIRSTSNTNGNCHYNYNFNMRIAAVNLKGHYNLTLNNNIDSLINSSPTHRALINIHSAPSSPANTQNAKTNQKQPENKASTIPSMAATENSSVEATKPLNECQHKSEQTPSSVSKASTKRITKIQKAKEHLNVILNMMSKCKNNPVWPYELITSNNYKQLTSVQLLSEFVSNLQSFLQLCFSTKQVSTISSSSTRSFSSPLNLDLNSRIGSRLCDKSLTNIDKKWSHYALISSLNTTSRHFAGRSLQIYRALGLKLNSFSTLINLIHRLMETVADSNEDVQGYVTEMLLTLKMNANLFSIQYLKSLSGTSNCNDAFMGAADTNSTSLITSKATSNKNKSKSLQLQFKSTSTDANSSKQNSLKKMNKSAEKSATTDLKLMSVNQQKSKTATLSRKEASEILQGSKQSEKPYQSLYKSSSNITKYKHQIAYKKSLTLSLFNQKWQILQDRIGNLNQTTNSNKIPKLSRYFLSSNAAVKSSNLTGANAENLRILVQIFWTCVCLLESDFEHEFVLAIEIIEQILIKIDLNTGLASNGQLLVHKNEFRTSLELFAFKINWPNFPGLQNLLLKGCTSTTPSTADATHHLLVELIPHCSKLNLIDPNGFQYNGLLGLSMNMIALLPTMILYYDQPNELCIRAAESYSKILKEHIKVMEEKEQKTSATSTTISNNYHGLQRSSKTENLKNLAHIMNLYLTNSFGKDRLQWTKCVITYLSEYFQQCINDQVQPFSSFSNFYLNWIVFLIEILDKHAGNIRYQSCVMTCLNSLLNYINFSDQSTWSFINEELNRVILKYINTNLWSEALELVKLTVSKSSSLTTKETSLPSNQTKSLLATSVPQTSSFIAMSHNFFGKKELPGRTLEFDFDFSLFLPNNNNQINFNKPPPPLNLFNFHLNKQYQSLNEYINGNCSISCNQNNLLQNNNNVNTNSLLSGWKRPQQSQIRTRERLFSLLNTLNRQQSMNNISNSLNNNNDILDSNDKNLDGSSFKNVDEKGIISLKKNTSIIFENSLNNSQNNAARYNTNTINDQLNSTTNESGSIITNLIDVDINNTTTGNNTSDVINSPITVNQKLLTVADSSSNSSTSNSATSTSASSSSSSSNITASSNNSLNQTSFVTSPTSNGSSTSHQFNQQTKPAIISQKPSSVVSILQHQQIQSQHQRKNSTAFIKTATSNQSIKSSSSNTNLLQPSASINSLQTATDDNNFISNTFSFLDELDNFDCDHKPQTNKTDAINLQLDSIISPITDQQQSIHVLVSPEAKKQASGPLSALTETIQKLSSYSPTKDSFKFSSKSKPIAPKPKSGQHPATIGVSSGVEALKNINNNNNDIKTEGSKSSNSTQPQLATDPIKNQKSLQSEKLVNKNNQEVRRRSITRIIKADSYQNLNHNIRHFSVSNILSGYTGNTINSSKKAHAPLSHDQNASSTFHQSLDEHNTNNQIITNHSNSLNSNVIYDHQQTNQLSSKTTPAKANQVPENKMPLNSRRSSSKSSILTNINSKFDNIAFILQTKRNKLRVSSVNNLSNLLALDNIENTNKFKYNNENTKNDLIGSSMSTSSSSSQSTKTKTTGNGGGGGLSPSLSSSSISKMVNNQENREKNYQLLKKHQQIYMKNSIIQICVNVKPYMELFLNQEKRNLIEIELSWKAHVSSMFKSSKVNPIETFLLFKILFNETIKHNLNMLLMECCDTLSKNMTSSNKDTFKQIESHLIDGILDLVNKKLDFPIVFFDKELLDGAKSFQNTHHNDLQTNPTSTTIPSPSSIDFLNKHKRVVWEIGENYDTFVYLKRSVSECLELIKTLDKESENESIVLEKKIDLCKNLCKFMSQFMLLLQSFSKLVPNITKLVASLSETIVDKSNELKRIKSSLSEALELSNSNECPTPIFNLSEPFNNDHEDDESKFKKDSKEMFVYIILESIKHKNFPLCIDYLRAAQTTWPKNFVMNVDFVLLLVCEQFRIKHSNIIACIDTSVASSDTTSDLNETTQKILFENIEITNLINAFDKKLKETSSSSSSTSSPDKLG